MNDPKASESPLELKSLVFQMYVAGIPQGAIAAYVGKSKSDINKLLKPLPKGKGEK